MHDFGGTGGTWHLQSGRWPTACAPLTCSSQVLNLSFDQIPIDALSWPCCRGQRIVSAGSLEQLCAGGKFQHM